MSTVSTEPVAASNGDAELPVGAQVGEYVIEALLGKGGFGTVYRAAHPVIGKQVAIKVLARKYAADPAVIQRFAAEARAVNQINHRNIIDIFQFSQLPDGRHYYVMECLEGEPLDRYLAAHGPMPLGEALPILKAIGRALDAAHAKGIAHRDLKPENIFLARDPDGTAFPKLLDFGIAKLLGPEVDAGDARFRTATGIPIGTPYYMSPEQCRGKDVDHRTDIYSFGIVAFRMLTGTYPFEGDDYVELLFKQVNEDPPLATTRNPALPPHVAEAIAWMMRKDPASRPASLADATAALAGGATSPAITPDAFARTITPTIGSPIAPVGKARRPAVWIGGALVLVCSAAGALVLLKTAPKDEPASRTTASLAMVSATAPADAPAPPDAARELAAPPVNVTISIPGLPPHAQITLGDVSVTSPAPLVVPKSATKQELLIEAPGFVAVRRMIVPDADQRLVVRLVKLPVHHTAEPHGEHDMEDVDWSKVKHQ